MIILQTIQEIQQHLEPLRLSGHILGFVPTMGYLHEGHLQLVRASKANCDTTIVSIFVNPIQFNNPDDLAKYPRNLDGDFDLLKTAGCDVVFVPSVEEMYPDATMPHFNLGPLAEVMEGFYRPGHFQGVAVVVHKFFQILQPHRAYFGLKDYQQLQVIHRLVEIERMNIEIIPCATMRESDGLAMSSRNVRLGLKERQAAPGIYAALQLAKKWKVKKSPPEVSERVKEKLLQIEGFRLEYLEIADARTLQTISHWKDAKQGAVICVAGYMGDVRLIDNVLL